MRILICEGNASTALDLWGLLHEQGHTVCGMVRDPGRCLDEVDRVRPDLVMLAEELRHDPLGEDLVETLAERDVPTVILAGDPGAVASAVHARAVLRKPIHQGPLLSAMTRAAKVPALPL